MSAALSDKYLVSGGYSDTKAVLTIDRSDLDAFEALVTLTHDGSILSINAAVSSADDNMEVTVVRVTNPDGIAIVRAAATDAVFFLGELSWTEAMCARSKRSMTSCWFVM